MDTRNMVPDHDLGKVCTGVGVGAIILGSGRFPHLGDEDDGIPRVLMGLRGQLRTRPGGPGVRNEPSCWDLPGGGIDFGETRADAVTREVREELGVDLGSTEELGTIDHQIRNAKLEVVEHWVTTTFLALLLATSPEPVVPKAERTKIIQLKFFRVSELYPMRLASTVWPSINLLRQRRRDLIA